MSDPEKCALFQFNEGSIELPADWRDLSVLVLSAADSNQRGISLTISRDAIQWGVTFREFAEQEISGLSEKLKDYQQINQQSGEQDGRETATAEFSWSSPEGPLHQVMMLLDLSPRVLVFTATVPGKMTDEQRQQIRERISTFRLRNAAAAE